MRLRQIASELREAIARDDMALIAQTTSLLAPTLAHCQSAFPASQAAAPLIAETCRLLEESEAALEQAMQQIAADLGQLRQGQRALAIVGARHRPVPGGRLDSRR